MDCIFCKIVAGEIESKQIYSDDDAIAFLDIEPWHPGHTVVVPRRHVPDVLSDASVLASLAPAIQAAGQRLVSALDADGMNVLSNVGETAGQSVFHLHVHLVPRFEAHPGLDNLIRRDDDIDVDEVFARITSS